MQIINTDETMRRYTIAVSGLRGIEVMGVAQPVELEGASTRLLALRLQAPVDAAAEGAPGPGTHKIELTVQAVDDASVVRHEPSTFIIPR